VHEFARMDANARDFREQSRHGNLFSSPLIATHCFVGWIKAWPVRPVILSGHASAQTTSARPRGREQ
jgi:hypothetical protein